MAKAMYRFGKPETQVLAIPLFSYNFFRCYIMVERYPLCTLFLPWLIARQIISLTS